jgi:hypothetical protein
MTVLTSRLHVGCYKIPESLTIARFPIAEFPFRDGFDLTVCPTRAGMDVSQRGRHVHERINISVFHSGTYPESAHAVQRPPVGSLAGELW